MQVIVQKKGERRDLYSRNERSMTAGCAFDHFMRSIASPACHLSGVSTTTNSYSPYSFLWAFSEFK